MHDIARRPERYVTRRGQRTAFAAQKSYGRLAYDCGNDLQATAMRSWKGMFPHRQPEGDCDRLVTSLHGCVWLPTSCAAAVFTVRDNRPHSQGYFSDAAKVRGSSRPDTHHFEGISGMLPSIPWPRLSIRLATFKFDCTCTANARR